MRLFFPDNTVLINFTLIERIDLLEIILNGRGNWVGAVHAECERSCDVADLSGMRDVFEFMNAPLIAETVERVDARAIQSQLRTPSDPPSKSYGEAETIAVLSRRRIDAVFLTDDNDAIAYISDEFPEIKVARTTDLLALAVNCGKLPADDAIANLQRLRARRRTRLSDERFRTKLHGRAT